MDGGLEEGAGECCALACSPIIHTHARPYEYTELEEIKCDVNFLRIVSQEYKISEMSWYQGCSSECLVQLVDARTILWSWVATQCVIHILVLYCIWI